MPEADALARPFDQARHVGDGQLAAVRRLDGAEHRLERRERIVGDLGRRVRETPQERRLAGVRQPGQRRVRDELQSELQRRLRARQARPPRTGGSAGSASRIARCPVPRSPRRRRRPRSPGRARSATSSPSSSLTCVPTGTASSTDAPSAPCFRVPRPFPPRPAANDLPAAEGGEVAQRRVGDERDVASASPVTAVRPAARDVLLAAEAQPTVPAASPSGRRSGGDRGTRQPPLPGGQLPSGARDRHRAALAAAVELHDALTQREERVVAAESDARAWAEPRPALAHEDHPGLHLLAGEDLDAEPLALGVATVLRGAEALLVCH